MNHFEFRRDPYVGWPDWLLLAVIAFTYGGIVGIGVFIGWLIFAS